MTDPHAAVPEPTGPAPRIGDAERTSAMDALGEHMRAGRLDPHEYDERVEAVAAARTRADIDPLFADLPAPHPPWDVVPVVAAPAAATAVPDHHGPLFGRVGTTIVSASPFVAVLLFFLTNYQWWWFLLVPLAGAIVYGGRREEEGRDRSRRRDGRRGR